MKLKLRHSAYLERAARKLSERTETKVTERQVLEHLLELAIHDEELFDPVAVVLPLSPTRRTICQVSDESASPPLGHHEAVEMAISGHLLR